MIHLDHETNPQTADFAIEQLKRAYQESWKPSSLEARYQVLYELAGASYDDLFVFTSSAAEAINQVHWSVYQERAKREGRCHFVTISTEGAAILQSFQRLESFGCYAKIAPVGSQGQIDLAALQELIGPRTALVSLSVADGLTGVIQPIDEIAEIVHKAGAWLHLEASSVLGKVYAPFQKADYLTFSGPSIHSVLGSGGLFVRRGRPLHPFILGGREQAGFRGGEFDLPSFLALASAAGQALLSADSAGLELARLRNRLEEGLKEVGAPLFADALRLPNVSTMAFPGAHQESLLYLLSRKGVMGSIGGGTHPPLIHALKESSISSEMAESALSFSLSRFTTEADIDRAIVRIQETAELLQQMSVGVFA